MELLCHRIGLEVMPQGISLTFNRVKEHLFSNLVSILEEVICTLFQIIVS